MNYRIIAASIIIISMVACNHSEVVRLQPGFTIYLNDTASAAVMNAVDILQRDLAGVLGEKAQISTESYNPGKIKNSLIIICPGGDQNNTVSPLEGFERHRIFTQNGNLVLQGSDTRGTIYAIFTFSEKILNIKPLWFWALHEPSKQEHLTIASDFSYDSGEPYVKYRAWFPNDTDMFTPWRRESKENSRVWLETMLRLKLNTVETGSSSDYSEPYAISDYTKLIHQFGLKITYHHVSALNSPYSNWDDYWEDHRKMPSPKLLLANQDELEEFWRYNVRSVVQSGIDPIWVVNFRGDRDIPFWETFPDAPERMEERAEVINMMVRIQMKILKEETQNNAPTARMIFYNELSDLLAAGLLKPPEEENLIWNFVAARRDHYPNDDIRSISLPANAKLGYYMNLQFTSTGSHLAQAEGPWKMERNYRFVDSRTEAPIFYSVMNAGNIREHLMTLSANASLLWNWEKFDSDGFLIDFCSNYYGEQHAHSIAGLYRDFFYAYWNQKKSDMEGFERQYIFHDLRYKQAIRQLSECFFEKTDLNPLKDYDSEQVPNRTFRIVPEDNGKETQIEAIIQGTKESYIRFSDVTRQADSIYNLLDEKSRSFFNDNLRIPSEFMMYLNESLFNYCIAYMSAPGTERQQHLKKSLSAAMDARESIYASAHGQFVNWYSRERIFDLGDYVNRIDQTLITCLQTQP